MLDDFTLYWLTNTAISAARFYWELHLNLYNAANVSIPAAVSVFPGENYQAPRSWTERAYHKLIYYNKSTKADTMRPGNNQTLFRRGSRGLPIPAVTRRESRCTQKFDRRSTDEKFLRVTDKQDLHMLKEDSYERSAFLLVAVATVAAVVASMIPASGQAVGQAAPVFVTKMPAGYRDWPVISVSHEAGNINSIGAVLGNDVAVKAYREGKLPFPDGAIIAAVHYHTCRLRKTTRSLAVINRSLRGPRRMSSLRSRTQRNTPRRAAGASATSTKTDAWQRRFDENLLPLSREGFARPCLHPYAP